MKYHDMGPSWGGCLPTVKVRAQLLLDGAYHEKRTVAYR